MRPYVAGTRAASPTRWSAPTPTPACPNAVRRVRRDARTQTAAILPSAPSAASLNIVGGCCGTTPDHIRADRRGGAGHAAARRPTVRRCHAAVRPRAARSSPTRPLFVNVGERTNVTGSAEVPQAHQGRRLSPRRCDVARQQVEAGAQIIDVNMDEGMLDSRGGDGRRSST
jgi:5-methyltetrahydrofolate--homocysteine methyltransferase